MVHHEYASIAQIEVPNGGDSNYDISNQISDFLENVVVKKLAVKPRSLPSTGNDMFDQIREQFAGGHLPSDKELNIGSEIADCRAYEFLGRLDVWQIDPLRFSKSRGMISFNWGGFLAAQPNGYVGFYAFLMNGVFDRHEFRAANGGNLIIEISVNPEAHFLKPNVIPSIGAPGSGLSAAAYIVCP